MTWPWNVTLGEPVTFTASSWKSSSVRAMRSSWVA